MKWTELVPKTERSFVVVFDVGDEIIDGLTRLAKDQGLSGARFSGIGALSDLRLGFYNPDKKDYDEIAINEQVELLSLVGNIGVYEGEPRLHAHIVVATPDGDARGGHLLEGHVRPTLEVFVVETEPALQRSFDERVGLPLIDL